MSRELKLVRASRQSGCQSTSHESTSGTEAYITRMRARAPLLLLLAPLLTALVLPERARACQGQIDLVVAMDSSGSVSDENYERQKDFAETFVTKFSSRGNKMGNQRLKISVLRFSTTVHTEIGLNSNYKKTLNAIKNSKSFTSPSVFGY